MSNSLAIFTVSGYITCTSSAHQGGHILTSTSLSCAHAVLAEKAEIILIYTDTHVYPDAEYVPRLHTAAPGPAAALDSCVDAPLLWGLALLSSVTVKSHACILASREG